jgi:fructose-1,6-bisphosphatase/inositol monophosphatase family enzyme
MGSAALDHCAVAEGTLDAYRLMGGSWLHGWDYLGGMLICTEAGAVVGELHGNELVVRDATRRSPVAAATAELLESLLAFEG